MAKAKTPVDIDSLRAELETVIRGWLGKSHLSLESVSSVSATTANFLKEVDRVLGGVDVSNPRPLRGRDIPHPPVTKRPPRSAPLPGATKSDRKEKVLGILAQAGRELRVFEVMERAKQIYPVEAWETRMVSTILGREAKRPHSRVSSRKKGKNFLYKFAAETTGGNQLPLKGGETP